MKAIVTRQELLTAMLFASTDESRYVLNGVCVDSTGAKPILVSTDGRRLCVIETVAEQDKTCGGSPIVLRGEFIKAIAALSKAIGGKLFPWVSLSNLPGSQRVQVEFIGGKCFLESEENALIAADFPNWRQVIPAKKAKRDPVSEIGLNAELVGDFAKAAKVLESQTPIVQMAIVGKESSVEVKIAGLPNFYGLVMQCKLESGAEYQPEFLGIVKDFPKPEPEEKPGSEDLENEED